MSLRCSVVTPEKTLLDQTVDFVALPLFDGEIGLAPGHSPMIGRLGYGEMRIRIGTVVHRYYVAGGFVEVVHDHVAVLTDQAVRADDLDAQAAADDLAAALTQTAHSEPRMAIRDREIDRARARLRVARHTAPV